MNIKFVLIGLFASILFSSHAFAREGKCNAHIYMEHANSTNATRPFSWPNYGEYNIQGLGYETGLKAAQTEACDRIKACVRALWHDRRWDAHTKRDTAYLPKECGHAYIRGFDNHEVDIKSFVEKHTCRNHEFSVFSHGSAGFPVKIKAYIGYPDGAQHINLSSGYGVQPSMCN